MLSAGPVTVRLFWGLVASACAETVKLSISSCAVPLLRVRLVEPITGLAGALTSTAPLAATFTEPLMVRAGPWMFRDLPSEVTCAEEASWGAEVTAAPLPDRRV